MKVDLMYVNLLLECFGSANPWKILVVGDEQPAAW